MENNRDGDQAVSPENVGNNQDGEHDQDNRANDQGNNSDSNSENRRDPDCSSGDEDTDSLHSEDSYNDGFLKNDSGTLSATLHWIIPCHLPSMPEDLALKSEYFRLLPMLNFKFCFLFVKKTYNSFSVYAYKMVEKPKDDFSKGTLISVQFSVEDLDPFPVQAKLDEMINNVHVTFKDLPVKKLVNSTSWTIICTIKFYEFKHIQPQVYEYQIEGYKPGLNPGNATQLQRDLHSVLDNGRYSDFTIKVPEKEFKVHKAMLAVRSQFFAELLMDGKCQGYFVDISADLMKEILVHIYTGAVPNFKVETGILLYEVAKMFTLQKLVERCSKFLAESLTEESVLSILMLARTHGDLSLQEKAIAYCISQFDPYDMIKGWLEFKNGHEEMASLISAGRHLKALMNNVKVLSKEEIDEGICL